MPPTSDDPITPQQCAAARAFLRWTQARLAEAAGVQEVTVNRFERSSDPAFAEQRKYKTGHTVKVALRVALESAGIAFDSGGVRPK